jgi:hypothetical protein
VAGCASSGPDAGGAAGTAADFVSALSRQDGQAACRLLVEAAASEVARSEGEPCAQAIVSLGLPTSASDLSAQAFGTQAQVATGEDVLFLSDSGGGWRVAAAGCHPESGDQPYSCLVTAG